MNGLAALGLFIIGRVGHGIAGAIEASGRGDWSSGRGRSSADNCVAAGTERGAEVVGRNESVEGGRYSIGAVVRLVGS